ncbi:MAG: PKD domain-containing protein, partial [Microthrixaceae bacterium]
LTVTDDDGATNSTTRQVSVSAPAGNTPPTASCTTQTHGRGVSVNAHGSTDGDGTITSYAWHFGDGSTGSGPTASRTYAAAGSYTITLTVTDDDGATNSTTRNVTVGSGVVHAGDPFERNVANGFGTADVGGAWSLSGSAANFAVNGGAGRVTLPSAGVSRAATLASVSAADVESVVLLSMDKAPSGGGTSLSTVVRKVGNSEYRLRVQLKPTSTNVQLQRVIGGAESTVLNQTLPGVVYTPGTTIHLKFRATGSGTTALAGKVWFGAAPEPAAWTIQAADTSAGLQGPGGVGVHAYVSSSATEVPIVMTVDNLLATSAQG